MARIPIPSRFNTPCTRKAYDRLRERLQRLTTPVVERSECEAVYHCCTHKAASTWFKNVLSDPRVFKYSGLTCYTYQRYLPDRVDRRPVYERDFYNVRFPRGIIATPLYADYPHFHTIGKPNTWRAFFVLRDPRDLVVSWYFSMRDTHPEMSEQITERRERLRRLDKQDGLSLAIEEMADQGIFESQRSWANVDDADNRYVKVVRFEELFGDQQFELMRGLMDHLRIPIPNNALGELLSAYSFQKLQDRNQHYRRGKSGNWARHLTEQHLELLENQTDDIVRTLGYPN
ncbi:MAG: sulfotransferase domain-containing protein [Salinibacter sp.]